MDASGVDSSGHGGLREADNGWTIPMPANPLSSPVTTTQPFAPAGAAAPSKGGIVLDIGGVARTFDGFGSTRSVTMYSPAGCRRASTPGARADKAVPPFETTCWLLWCSGGLELVDAGKTMRTAIDRMDGEKGALERLRSRGWTPGAAIDAGAFRGAWTQLLNVIWPDTPTLMIEAQSDLVPVLQRNAVSFGRHIVTRQGLLASQPGLPIDFFVPTAAGISATGASIYPEQTGIPLTRMVQTTTTIDAVVAQWDGPIPNLLKMDLQGAERDALQGASRTLGEIELIQLELSVLPYNRGAPLITEMISFLDSLGFVLFDLCDTRRIAQGALCQIDALFARKNHWLFPH